MKKMFAVIALGAFLCLSGAAQTGSAKKQTVKKKTSTALTMKTQKGKMSYIIGYDIGKNIRNDFKQRGFDVDNDVLLEGLKQALAEKPSVLSEEETKAATEVFQQEMMEKQNSEISAEKQKGEKFLAENARKDSVKVTASGLQYKMLVEGTGKSPMPTDTVVVHYRGKLIDGTVFDESYKRGEPATFPLNQVIKGWTEGLQLLKEGGKAELYLSSDLGYGDRGAGGLIQPGAALVFEVELITVK